MAVKIGTLKSEKIIGLATNDTITGLQGMDTLSGGAGNDFIDGGVDNDSLNGETGDDILLGGDGDDNLKGGSGNDKLDGGKDNDKILGEAGNDTLIGGLGVDTLIGGDGNDYYVVDNLKDVVSETNKIVKTGGNDTVETTLLDYKLADNVENLVLIGEETSKSTGNKGNNTMTGNSADNLLSGDAGNDSLIGGAGVDTLDGGLGMDTLVGGADSDFYFMNNTEDKIVETEDGGDLDQVNATVSFNLNSAPNVEALELSGTKAISGTGNELDNLIQEIDGGNVSVNLKGMEGDDTLNGAGGNDTLEGGANNDIIDGGDGEDTAIYNNLKSQYEITTNVDTSGVKQIVVKYVGDTENEKFDEGEDILSNIEFVQFSDGTSLNANDIMAGNLEGSTPEPNDETPVVKPVVETPVVKPVVIPNNTLTALPKDTRAYAYEFPLTDGDGGADALDGSPEDEKFFGLGGNDVLNAKAGNDYLDGGVGDDKLYGELGDDYLLGGVGADSIWGGEGKDSIDGGEGNDSLVAEKGDDLIIGGEGDDRIEAGAGNDKVYGNEGNNTLYGHDGDDEITAGAGNDVIDGGIGHDNIYGGAGNDNIQGDDRSNNYGDYGLSNDTIDGGDGDDTIQSDDRYTHGNDSVNGGNGNDTIDSSHGIDTIHGGDGNDSIRDWANGAEANMVYGDAGDDSIVVAGGELHGGLGNDYLEGYWLLMGDEGLDTLVGKDNTSGTFIGGLDADKITTDGGADIVRYMTIADSKPGVATRDVITDFDTSSGDVLDLYRLSSDPLTYLGMKAFDGTKGAVRFQPDSPHALTLVQVDTNGDKVPDMEIELTGLKFLAADDFILSAPRV